MRVSIALAAFLAVAGPRPVSAFSGKVHEEVSREALTDMSFDGAAADQVVVGNLNTDKDESDGGEFWTPAAHFDNEQVAAGAARLKLKLNEALDALDDCNAVLARERLGRALHGVQDFLAHSNWVENHGSGDALDPLTLTDPAKDVVCEPKTHKGALTTGYYFRDKTQAPPPGKCLHDGKLNKDDPSRPFHAEARARGLIETKAMLARFDRAVRIRFAAVGAGETHFRLRLLKDTSAGFEEQRRGCRPRPAAGGSRPLPMPPGVDFNPWR